MSAGTPRPTVLDVDTGIDDALALALAVRAPECDLVAVTTVAGNVGIERATANTLAVLAWLGADAVPVHRGASRPLVRPHEDASFVHGTDGLGNAGLPTGGQGLGPDRGPAAIVRLANARPGELTMVCLGPLTNLAIALNVEPRLPELLARLVVMGGAFARPGNVTPRAEYNIWVDPEAAGQVAAAPWLDLTVVGLDVSERTRLSRSAWEAAVVDPAPDAQLVARVCRRSFEERGVDGVALHDPLAVATALDPGLVETETGTVEVGTEGEARGETRLAAGGRAAVARGVEADRFLRRFEETLGLPSPA